MNTVSQPPPTNSDIPQPNANPPLFRQEAITAAAGTQLGDPLETYWRGTYFFTLAAFVIFAGLLLLLVVVEYSPVHRIPAFVDFSGGVVRLGAPADGRVRAIAVEEGQTVKAGDIVAIVDSDRHRPTGESRRDAIRQRLVDESQSLSAEVEAARAENRASAERIARVIAGLRAERTASLADITAGQKLLESLRAQSTQIDSVAARGYYTQIQAAQKRDEVLVQEGRLAASRASLARVERDIETANAELRVNETKLQAVIESRRRVKGELERRGLEADAEAEQVILAPQGGIVSSALISQGQSVVLGQVLFTIAPADEPLIVRLIIPPRAAATVRPGAEVKLSFQAYPREKYGEFTARVQRVSATPSMPADLPAVQSVREPAFLGTAVFLTSPVNDLGQPLPLKPGMLADALVPIERRRAIEWLFEPIIRGFNESAGRVSRGTAGDGVR